MDVLKVPIQVGMGVSPQKKELTQKAKRKFPATLEDTKQAITISKGNLTKAAMLLDVPRSLLQRKIDISPILQHHLKDVLDERLDDVQDAVFEEAERGNVTAGTFLLRTLGKHRGFSESHTVEHELGSGAMKSAAALVEALRQRDKGNSQAQLPGPVQSKEPDIVEVEWHEVSQGQTK